MHMWWAAKQPRWVLPSDLTCMRKQPWRHRPEVLAQGVGTVRTRVEMRQGSHELSSLLLLLVAWLRWIVRSHCMQQSPRVTACVPAPPTVTKGISGGKLDEPGRHSRPNAHRPSSLRSAGQPPSGGTGGAENTAADTRGTQRANRRLVAQGRPTPCVCTTLTRASAPSPPHLHRHCRNISTQACSREFRLLAAFAEHQRHHFLL